MNLPEFTRGTIGNAEGKREMTPEEARLFDQAMAMVAARPYEPPKAILVGWGVMSHKQEMTPEEAKAFSRGVRELLAQPYEPPSVIIADEWFYKSFRDALLRLFYDRRKMKRFIRRIREKLREPVVMGGFEWPRDVYAVEIWRKDGTVLRSYLTAIERVENRSPRRCADVVTCRVENMIAHSRSMLPCR